jgi:excisionase family DNA binding protein
MTEPLTISVEDAAKLLGLSRGLAYEAARRGELPTIRLGRRLLVPTARLLELVGAPPSFAGVNHNGEEARRVAAESKARLSPGFTTT